jgi:hypothetical protein
MGLDDCFVCLGVFSGFACFRDWDRARVWDRRNSRRIPASLRREVETLGHLSMSQLSLSAGGKSSSRFDCSIRRVYLYVRRYY